MSVSQIQQNPADQPAGPNSITSSIPAHPINAATRESSGSVSSSATPVFNRLIRSAGSRRERAPSGEYVNYRETFADGLVPGNRANHPGRYEG